MRIRRCRCAAMPANRLLDCSAIAAGARWLTRRLSHRPATSAQASSKRAEAMLRALSRCVETRPAAAEVRKCPVGCDRQAAEDEDKPARFAAGELLDTIPTGTWHWLVALFPRLIDPHGSPLPWIPVLSRILGQPGRLRYAQRPI